MQVLVGRGAALRRVVPPCGPAALRSCGWRKAALKQQLAAPCPRTSGATTTTRAAIEPPYDAGANVTPATPPVYSDWAVYSLMGAMIFNLIKPTWRNTSNVGSTVDRPGRVLLKFALPLGQRGYDWQNKIMVALTVMELAQILAELNAEHSFLHDPNKMDPSAKGSKTTSLRWTPAPDGKAYFVTAAQGGSVQGAAKSSVTVTLSKADCYVFEKLGRFAIPHLLGMDMVVNAV